MECEIDSLDCVEISYAAHKLDMYSKDLSRHMAKRIEEYGESDVSAGVSKGFLESTTDARIKLLKIANRCGCNIDLKTGELK